MSDMESLNAKSVRGFVRADGLGITIYSTRRFSAFRPVLIGRAFDRGEIECGDWEIRDGQYERAIVSIRMTAS